MHLPENTGARTLSDVASSAIFLVSLNVGNELVEATREAGWTATELVVILLTISTLLLGLPAVIGAVLLPHGEKPHARSLPAFLGELTAVAQRVAAASLVQAVTVLVRAEQPLRSLRVITLLSIAVFFVFLESTATSGALKKRRD